MAPMEAILHQAGVIAYRMVDGKIQVLLVTSRETARWIVPKGNIAAGSTAAQAAKREALEEAGIKGVIANSIPLGMYTYFKKLPSGERRAATVEVYLLRVTEELKEWPERRQRKLAWVATTEAIRIIEEPGMVPLLKRLAEFEGSLVNPEGGSSPELQSGPPR
ncbi:MAG: hydrolase [Rhodospirillales bacterium]|nr:hydrolase [Rhodospirillales bacterium]